MFKKPDPCDLSLQLDENNALPSIKTCTHNLYALINRNPTLNNAVMLFANNNISVNYDCHEANILRNIIVFSRKSCRIMRVTEELWIPVFLKICRTVWWDCGASSWLKKSSLTASMFSSVPGFFFLGFNFRRCNSKAGVLPSPTPLPPPLPREVPNGVMANGVVIFFSWNKINACD